MASIAQGNIELPKENKGKKRVLHVGCGMQPVHDKFRGPMWEEVRLDISESCKPHIIANMCDMHMIKDKEFDAIYSSHNIEHLFENDLGVALKEFYRVLKVGGFAYIATPDLQKVADLIAKGKVLEPVYTSPVGPIYPLDIVYGHRPSIAKGSVYMAHKFGFTAISLGKYLKAAGFVDITVQRQSDGYNLYSIGYRLEDEKRKKAKSELSKKI